VSEIRGFSAQLVYRGIDCIALREPTVRNGLALPSDRQGSSGHTKSALPAAFSRRNCQGYRKSQRPERNIAAEPRSGIRAGPGATPHIAWQPGASSASFSLMHPLRTLGRRWISTVLAIVFGLCLSEAVVPEACDGDSAGTYVVSAGNQSGQSPADRPPGHGGPHLCHCAHTTGALSGVPPRPILASEHHVESRFVTPSKHFGRTPEPEPRPPTA
jgi:hypothetical protein